MPVTLFMEDVTVLDYARLDADAGAVGDTLVVGVELDGDVDAHGFIVDFGKAKALVKQTIDREVDHRLLVPRAAHGLSLTFTGGAVSVHYGGVDYTAPAAAVAAIDAVSATRETIAAHLTSLLSPLMPANVRRLRVDLQAHVIAPGGAAFCYTHGLRHHDGNCQRLLHGHRGAFVASWDGRVDATLTQWLADRFSGAHFAAERDADGDRVYYAAAQGTFTLAMPRGRVVAVAAEPSIENLARFAFATVVRERRLDPARLAVRGYEGARKGASFSAA